MDESTRARINLNAVLRALEQLPALDSETAGLVADAPQTIRFRAPGVGTVRLTLGGGAITHDTRPGPATIGLLFPRPALVNRMFAGTGRPIPTRGLRRLGYLTGPFTRVTGRLAHLLTPTPELLDDPAYRRANAILTLHVAAYALAEIGNGDPVGRAIAARMPDGAVQLAVTGGPALVLRCRAHRLAVEPGPVRDWRARMTFADLDSAGQVLRGELGAHVALGRGRVELAGYLPLLDAVNKLLGLVPRYLG